MTYLAWYLLTGGLIFAASWSRLVNKVVPSALKKTRREAPLGPAAPYEWGLRVGVFLLPALVVLCWPALCLKLVAEWRS